MPRSSDTAAAVAALSPSSSHSITTSPTCQLRRPDLRSAASPADSSSSTPRTTTTSTRNSAAQYSPGRHATTPAKSSTHRGSRVRASATATATVTGPTASSAPPQPQPQPQPTSSVASPRGKVSRSRSRPATPPFLDMAHENDEIEAMDDNTTHSGSSRAKPVYTPASTTSSGLNSAFMEVDAAECKRLGRRQSSASGGNEWTRDEALMAVSKELLNEVKKCLLQHGPEDGVSDVLRLKQDHRASLTSLAASHRKEIADLKQTHQDELLKLQLQYLKDLKEARKNHGHNDAVITELETRYTKALREMSVDLTEAKREHEEFRLKSLVSAADKTGSDYSDRELDIKVQFENLEEPFGVAEFSIPHPGPSFEKLKKALACTVKNHFKALHDSADFFITQSQDDHVSLMKSIHHFYHAIKARNVQFHFSTEAQEKLWEEEQWQINDFVLEAECTTDGWERVRSENSHGEESGGVNIDFQEIESVDSNTERQPSCDGSDDSVSTVPTRNYQAAAELSNIHREVGRLHTHQQLPSDPETEMDAPEEEEDKENFDPSSSRHKVTVESVLDETDVPTKKFARESRDKCFTVQSEASTPRPQVKQPEAPKIWEDKSEPDEPTDRSQKKADSENDVSVYLKAHLVNLEPVECSPNRSWCIDPTLTTLPEKVEEKSHANGTSLAREISEKLIPNVPRTHRDPLIPKFGSDASPLLPPRWTPSKSASDPETPKNYFSWPGVTCSTSSPKFAACSGPLEAAILEGSMSNSSKRGPWANGFLGMDEPILRHTLSEIKEESTVPPEAPECHNNEYSQSGSEEPDTADTDVSEVPVPVHGRRPFSEIRRPSTPGARTEGTHCGVSTTPLLDNSDHRKRQTPSPREGRFSRISEDGENLEEGEIPPFAPTVTAATTPSTKRRQPTFVHGLGNVSGGDNDDDYAESTCSSRDDYMQSDLDHDRGHSSWQRHHNHERDYRGSDSPAPSDASYTTSDQRTAYNPSSMYHPGYGGGIMNMPLRWPQIHGLGQFSSRFPMGGYHGQQGSEYAAFQAQQMRHMQMQEALLSQNGGRMPGSSNASASFVTGGPVYAPNPPHSLSRSNSMPAGINAAYNSHRGSISLEQPSTAIPNPAQTAFPWQQMHNQISHPQLFNGMPTPTELPPHRSFSSDNLWQHNMGAGIMRNDGPTPMQMPRASPIAVSTSQDQNMMSGMMPGWMPFAPQPNTPGSQTGLGMHMTGRATAPPQSWMGPEGQWMGASGGMGMGMGMGMAQSMPQGMPQGMAQGMGWAGGYSA
ncbi:hypothetical protein EX30DRAFT_48460 [Ascodesmis nigricans]|uniref:Uncharacterized protein n=1 Tax=Ascodesmis nigricans TaxID=341454 RepID=A0A4S2MVW7_9PEZI|nr:hypothetical protein EX30DRAFT_48460 [Ascodesmis nigricans]